MDESKSSLSDEIYRRRRYKDNVKCQWTLAPPLIFEEEVVLTFASFETEREYDFLKICTSVGAAAKRALALSDRLEPCPRLTEVGTARCAARR